MAVAKSLPSLTYLLFIIKLACHYWLLIFCPVILSVFAPSLADLVCSVGIAYLANLAHLACSDCLVDLAGLPYMAHPPDLAFYTCLA